ncbi:MAG: lysophospholipid acyltransferase family protein, partial [Bacteroidetes bacterium]|nr:lysophospholipid acyltransferase family protein [Bacteroidota bacterium]
FSFLNVYLIAYKKEVIKNNLSISFPDMSDKEKEKVIHGFYNNLSDVMVETIKAFRISREDLIQRMTFSNIEALEVCKKRGQTIVFLASHQCNWEWLLLSAKLQLPYTIYGVYKPLQSKKFDVLMVQVRSRFGGILVPSQKVVRNIAEKREEVRALALVADQRPFIGTSKVWTTMFGKDTAFHTGIEQVPKLANAVVFCPRIKRIRRGYYHAELVKITEPPYSDQKSNDEIISKYVKVLEEMIMHSPSDWLWSHDRWKYTKEEGAKGYLGIDK